MSGLAASATEVNARMEAATTMAKRQPRVAAKNPRSGTPSAAPANGDPNKAPRPALPNAPPAVKNTAEKGFPSARPERLTKYASAHSEITVRSDGDVRNQMNPGAVVATDAIWLSSEPLAEGVGWRFAELLPIALCKPAQVPEAVVQRDCLDQRSGGRRLQRASRVPQATAQEISAEADTFDGDQAGMNRPQTATDFAAEIARGNLGGAHSTHVVVDFPNDAVRHWERQWSQLWFVPTVDLGQRQDDIFADRRGEPWVNH